MTLSKDAIAEFQKLYLSEFGIALSHEEASEKARNLLRFFKIAYGLENPDENLTL